MISRWRGMTRFGLLLVCLIVGAVQTADAQRMRDRPNAIEAEKAISQLWSPYCPGFMLSVCTSSQAALLRDSIYDLAAEGMTSNEIVGWMLSRHGEEYRAVPLRSGAGLWAWLIPPLVLLVGLGVAVMWLKANRAPEEKMATDLPEISNEDRAMLESALEEWDRVAAEEDL